MADGPPNCPPPDDARSRYRPRSGMNLSLQIPQPTAPEVMKMPSPVQPFDPADYEFISHMGSGVSGSVDRVRNKHTRQEYARKRIRISDGTTDEREKQRSLILREMETVAQLNHPNLVKLVSGWASITEIQMMFELMDGSLKDFHTEDEKVIAHIAQQILTGLSYLRDERIIHRDLKPANVLRNNYGNVKIADFGSSRRLDIGNMQSILTVLGTIQYCSPEMLQHQLRKTDQSDKSDVWSLGILLLEIYMGHFPFPYIDKFQTYNEIINDFVVPELPDSTS